MNLKEAEYFLEKVNEIYKKIPKKEKTFMEISGYPHYENVCSNILAFYFNPNEEHKMDKVLLETLLIIAKEKNPELKTNVKLDNINVIREYTTEEGNRIDIVMYNPEIAIGIENKIMAKVNNDLVDYANTLEKINKNTVKILLSLHNEANIAEQNNFINITYDEFLDRIKSNISMYEDKQNKWYIYLMDFIKNIEGYKVEKDMEENINDWIKEHQTEINEFYELMNIVKINMDKKIIEYGELLEKMANGYKVKYWQDSDVQHGAYILLVDLGCNIDALLTIDGWKIRLNPWKKMNQSKIKQILSENNCTILKEENGYLYLYNFDNNHSIIDIANKSKDILDLLEKVK